MDSGMREPGATEPEFRNAAPPGAADDELKGTTGDQRPNPNALVQGNRVAAAEDME